VHDDISRREAVIVSAVLRRLRAAFPTATIIAAQGDPNTANNTATTTTLVAAPFISIVPGGAVLTEESGPTNGAIDLGETVTVVLYLSNAGNVSTTNLVATLLATNGVVPSPTNNVQTFGSLLPSSFPVGSNFTFTASGASGGTISAILQLQDGARTYPPVSYTFTLPTTQVSANKRAILIPDPAAPQSFDASHNLDRSGKLILDEADTYGVEMALQLVDKAGGGEVTVVSMGSAADVAGLRNALAMGAAKAVIVSDDSIRGTDSLGTAKVLAAVIRRAMPDLILCATESSDGYTGTTPVQLAELLGLPSITFAKSVTVEGSTVKVDRQTESGYDEVTAPLPASPSPPALLSPATRRSRASWPPSPSPSRC